MTIMQNIRTFAKFFPGRTATIDDTLCLTYRELELLSTNWALTFWKAGIRKYDRVMVCMRNSSRFIGVIVALEKLDAVIMPMNYQLFQKDSRRVCNEYDVKAIITEPFFEDTFAGLEQIIVDAEKLELDFTIRSETESASLTDVYADDSEMIFFTSGSTGKPKGIGLLKTSLNPTVLPDYMKKQASIHLLVRPIFFRSHFSLAYSTLLQGDTLAVSKSDNPRILYELLTTHQANQMTTGPSDLYELVNYMEKMTVQAPPSLREVLTTGRALPDDLKKKLLLYFPHCEIIDFYGTSEVGAISSINKSEWTDKSGSTGKPEFFIDILIIDENKEEVGTGEVGEIYVKSNYAMEGYKFEESLRDQAFVGDYISTGDMGYLDEDGYLFLMGRKKEVINRGGFYFYPSELEKSMLEISGVRQAAVLPVPDNKWGQVPAAFIVLEESYRCMDEYVVREWIQAKLLGSLPLHKMPEYILFIELLPVNLGGKIDSHQLLDILASVTNPQ
ncbi:acyl-coenzyme A synthetase/AMP-(fatty) acid ligase [Sporosarcina luteola]|nr:acyl-coenzyme A synthetase/AMP-(fatty) acid ligase [Sporosarcina luteola]